MNKINETNKLKNMIVGSFVFHRVPDMIRLSQLSLSFILISLDTDLSCHVSIGFLNTKRLIVFYFLSSL